MDQRKRPNFFQRKYLIDKGFQLKYTFIIVAVCSLIYCVLGYYFYKTSLDNTDLLAVKNFELQGEIAFEDNLTLWILLGAFMLQIGSLFVLGTLLTHRIVGPTFVLGRTLSNIAEGKLQFMRPLRKSDEFHEFVDRINGVIGYVRSSLEQDLRALETIAQHLGSETSDAEKAKGLIEDLKNAKQKLLG